VIDFTYVNWNEVPLFSTAAEAAMLFGVHEKTVKKWINQGELRAIRTGNKSNGPIRIPKAALQEYENTHLIETESQPERTFEND